MNCMTSMWREKEEGEKVWFFLHERKIGNFSPLSAPHSFSKNRKKWTELSVSRWLHLQLPWARIRWCTVKCSCAGWHTVSSASVTLGWTWPNHSLWWETATYGSWRLNVTRVIHLCSEHNVLIENDSCLSTHAELLHETSFEASHDACSWDAWRIMSITQQILRAVCTLLLLLTYASKKKIFLFF